jgi:hypothetical protein
MMPNPSDTYGNQFSGGVQTRWNATSIKAWKRCPRYYKYSILEGWQGEGTSVHLTFGSIYAKALEHFHVMTARGMPREDAIREVVRAALIDSHGWHSDHPAKYRWTLIRSIVWYFDEWSEDLPLYHLADQSPAVELVFEIDGLDSDLSFVGTLDRLVWYGDTLVWMDQKTTGSALSSYYFSQFELDDQASLYTFAGQAVFSSDIKGGIIDAAEVKVGFTRFGRHTTFRTPAQIEEWYVETSQILRRAQQDTADGYFPRNTTACTMYGGCPYRNICSKSPEHREKFLPASFTKMPASFTKKDQD